MKIQENILLAPYTTFKIGGPARFFCFVENQFDALAGYEFAKKNNLKVFVLGGGSNILVSDKGFNGLVVKVQNKGIEVINKNNDDVLLRVASGEVWDEVVSFAVKNSWWGIENLSRIPGSSGAIAVQNVGAYGQEAKNIISSVTVFDTQTHQISNLSNGDCGFGYRKSIFNSEQKGEYVIFSIDFILSKIAGPNLSYGDLRIKFGDASPSLAEIRNAVIGIRDKKFPFPREAVKGNAGSFFKNPVLSPEGYKNLRVKIAAEFGKAAAGNLGKKIFTDDNLTKVPAAFLIELCGLKNLQSGGAGLNQNQPLVIINQTGTATAEDIMNLANQVRSAVLEKTGISLVFEPELIGF